MMETILYVGLLIIVAFVAGVVGYEIRNFQLRRELKKAVAESGVAKELKEIAKAKEKAK